MPNTLKVTYTADIKLIIISKSSVDKQVLLDKARETVVQWEMKQNDTLSVREEDQIIATRIHVRGGSEREEN